MILAYDLPRIGRYRLYDRAGKKGTLWRCRLCGRSFKTDSLWKHFQLEKDRQVTRLWSPQAILELRIRLATSLLRSRRNLRRARWEYTVRKSEEP
jgi:hypothetical protein